MSNPVPVRDLIRPDLLATPDVLVAVTGRSEANARRSWNWRIWKKTLAT